MFESAQQIAAKATALRIRTGKGLPLENLREELVRQFTRVVVGAAFAPEKRDDWCVVGGAQIAERLARARGIAMRREDLRPASGRKHIPRRRGGLGVSQAEVES